MSSPYINRFLQPDTLIPDLSNPQSWNRYSYVENSPIVKNDPTGHCAAPGLSILCGALIGGIVGGSLYILSELRQPQGFNLHDKQDLKDLAWAVGVGAAAGGLIGSGVGAPAGVEMLMGLGIASTAAVDHVTNIATGTNFDAKEHFTDAGVGAMAGGGLALAGPGASFLMKGFSAMAGGAFMRYTLDTIDPAPDDERRFLLEAGSNFLGGAISTGSDILDTSISFGIDTGVSTHEKMKQQTSPSSIKWYPHHRRLQMELDK